MKHFTILFAGMLFILMLSGMVLSQDTTLTVTSDGKVGIGISDPRERLEVLDRISITGAGLEGGELTLMDGDSEGGWEIDNYGAPGQEGIRFFRGRGFNNIFDVLVLKNSGNVGIGTFNPASKFEIMGKNETTGLRVAWGDQFASLYGEFKHAGSGGLQINANANGGWADMSLQTDGTTRLFIESQGSVGIGTITPASKLEVAGTIHSTSGGIKFPDGSVQSTAAISGSSLWSQSASNIYYNSGNVGIGTASPLAALHVNGDYYGKGHLFLHAYQGNGLSGTAYIQARDMSESSDIDMQFRTQNAGAIVEAVKITKEGNVGIGTTTPAFPLHVITTGLVGQHVRVDRSSTSTSATDGISVSVLNTAAGSSQTLGINSYSQSDSPINTGTVWGIRGVAAGISPGAKIGVYGTVGGNGSKWAVYAEGDMYTTGQYLPSDQKLKKDVQKLSAVLPKLMQLDVKSYNYKTDDPQYKHMNLPDKKQFGLIAQDVEKIFPELVKNVIHPAEINEDGIEIGPEIKSKSINYTALIPMLLQAIQELQERVAELEQR